MRRSSPPGDGESAAGVEGDEDEAVDPPEARGFGVVEQGVVRQRPQDEHGEQAERYLFPYRPLRHGKGVNDGGDAEDEKSVEYVAPQHVSYGDYSVSLRAHEDIHEQLRGRRAEGDNGQPDHQLRHAHSPREGGRTGDEPVRPLHQKKESNNQQSPVQHSSRLCFAAPSGTVFKSKPVLSDPRY